MNKKLTLSDIAGLLAERSGKKRKAAEEFLREFIAVVSEGLFVDKLVKIDGLGTFKIIPVEQRESVRVNTGERFVIPAHYKYSFLPDKELRDTVNAPFSFFETTEIVRDAYFSDLEESEEEETDSDEESVEELLPEPAAAAQTDRAVREVDASEDPEILEIPDVSEVSEVEPLDEELSKAEYEPVPDLGSRKPEPETPAGSLIPDQPEAVAPILVPAAEGEPDAREGITVPEETTAGRKPGPEKPDEGGSGKNERMLPADAGNEASAKENPAPAETPDHPALADKGRGNAEAENRTAGVPQESDEERPGSAGQAFAGADSRPVVRSVPEPAAGVFAGAAGAADSADKTTEQEAAGKNGKVPAGSANPAADKPSASEIRRKNGRSIGGNTSGKPDSTFYKREFFLAAVILAAFTGISVLLYRWYTNQPVKKIPVAQRVSPPVSAAADSLSAAFGASAAATRGNDSLPAQARPDSRAGTEMPLPDAGRAQQPAADAAHGAQTDSLQQPGVAAAVAPARRDTSKQTPAIIGHVKIAAGDRLTLIALKYYGHKFFWVYIYEANKDIIRNPNNVPIGTVLKIASPETYGIDANDRASVARAAALQTKILQGEK